MQISIVLNSRPIITRFEKELEEIQFLNLERIENSKRVIHAAQDCLQLLKQDLLHNPPPSAEEEVYFFRFTKQIPLQELIYHAELRSFELQFPKIGKDAQRIYTLKKVKKINRFFLKNIVFCQYLENKIDHFDKHYFTREFGGEYNMVHSDFLFRDREFSTSHDLLLGKTLAYTKLADYLKNRLLFLDNPHNNRPLPPLEEQELTWTSSPTDLVELIYALHYSGSINNGNAGLKNIASTLGILFHIELGDIYRTYVDIKRRRKDRTKFLNNLSSGLDSQIDESES